MEQCRERVTTDTDEHRAGHIGCKVPWHKDVNGLAKRRVDVRPGGNDAGSRVVSTVAASAAEDVAADQELIGGAGIGEHIELVQRSVYPLCA